MRVRVYGRTGPEVVVIHGGPGAPGHMAPVARGLAGAFRVLEPMQRGSGGARLTVARHVADLRRLVESRCSRARPALVGSSWGAMLALAYAAAHPDLAGPLVLIGCGTFDTAARDRLRANLDKRMDAEMARRVRRLAEEFPEPDERLRMTVELLMRPYSHDLATTDLEVEAYDARAYQESWEDMLRLQAERVYPAAFAAIDAPVLMLHGAVDPHPGRMIRESLQPYLPQLEYRQWDRCGHFPWLENAVREEFFCVLRAWLARNLTGGTPASRESDR